MNKASITYYLVENSVPFKAVDEGIKVSLSDSEIFIPDNEAKIYLNYGVKKVNSLFDMTVEEFKKMPEYAFKVDLEKLVNLGFFYKRVDENTKAKRGVFDEIYVKSVEKRKGFERTSMINKREHRLIKDIL